LKDNWILDKESTARS